MADKRYPLGNKSLGVRFVGADGKPICGVHAKSKGKDCECHRREENAPCCGKCRCESPFVMENGRCGAHGGKTPKGVASVHFVDGSRSKYAPPARLLEDYKRGLEDGALLELRNEIALVDARLADLVRRVDQAESGEMWTDLQEEATAARAALAAKDEKTANERVAEIFRLIHRGATDAATWEEIRVTLHLRRRLVESERKRFVEMGQVLSAERMLTMVAALTAAVRKHVNDPRQLAAIAADFGSVVAGDSGGSGGSSP